MGSVEDDPRFAHVASDPRFKAMPKSKKKVKIDSRFQSLFTNKHFSHKVDMDKRGRPALNKTKKNKSTMERFYEMSSSDSSSSEDDDQESESDEDLSNDAKSALKKEDEEKDSSDLLKKTVKNAKQKKSKNSNTVNDKKKTEIEGKVKTSKKKADAITKTDTSDEDEESASDGSFHDEEGDKDELQDDTSDDENDSDDEDLPLYSAEYDLEETDHQWNELEKDAGETTESTKRIAVCNMDWDFVKAQDLFVLFQSFVPEGGSIKSVAIYPSEFGKERMAEEVRMGPKEIREHTLSLNEEKANKKKKGKKIDQQKEKSLKKSNEEIHTEKLREYQLNRLKYYYAVVDCDSVTTADNVYTECDGREYQLSSVRLDLRFIPDDMTFDDEPKEVFSDKKAVVSYQPSAFESSALCNAKVEVTWDETEFDRLSRRVGGMQQKDLESIIEDNKYADIIAPPESDSEEDGDRPEWLEAALAQESDEKDGEEMNKQNEREKNLSEKDKIRLYRKLLVDKLAEEEEEKEKEEGDVDKVLEFAPGLKSDAKQKLKKKEKNNKETAVVNDYLEKKREKKKKKKNLKKQKLLAEQEVASDDDELMDVDDSLKEMMQGEEVYEGLNLNKQKKKKKKLEETANEDDDKERAELELMLMDDDDNTKHFKKPEIVDDNESKSKKKRKSKKAMAKQKKMASQEVEKDDFVMDINDNRFSALFSSHHFHIDPTAPQFKKTKNMVRLMDEQIKKKKSGKKRSANFESDGQTGETTKSSQSVSQSLVESLKKKMKKK